MLPEHHKMIQELLMKAGLPTFPLDTCGYPEAGAIIKYFREKMTYTDPKCGKIKKWTQLDLAKRLGTSEVTVRLMETQNKGLDSIERRSVLATILRIPPALLGLASLSDLTSALEHYHEDVQTVFAPSQRPGAGSEHIKLYQDAFRVYSEMHATNTAQGALFDMGQWMQRIESDLPTVQASQKALLYRTLWDFHALSAKIYSDDLGDWVQSFNHLNAALELANVLNSDDLRAASLYRSGQIRFAQRNFALAKSDLDGALVYARGASPNIKGAVFAAAGLAHALVDTDTAGITYAQRLLDQAQRCIVETNSTDDTIIKFNREKYLLERADALIALGRPGKALELLEDAEDGLDPTQKRRIAYLNILRADAYMRLKRPEFDTVLILLTDAFGTSKKVRSEYNIGYIERLYKVLSASSYGTAPEVADLGIALRAWRGR